TDVAVDYYGGLRPCGDGGLTFCGGLAFGTSSRVPHCRSSASPRTRASAEGAITSVRSSSAELTGTGGAGGSCLGSAANADHTITPVASTAAQAAPYKVLRLTTQKRCSQSRQR